MLFRRRKSSQPDTVPQENKIARFMANRILWCQMQFVNRMSRLDSKATPKQKKIAFLSFCAVMATIYLINLYTGFTSKTSTYPIHQEHIQIPRDIALPDSIAAQQMKRLQEWKQHQDSLHEKK